MNSRSGLNGWSNNSLTHRGDRYGCHVGLTHISHEPQPAPANRCLSLEHTSISSGASTFFNPANLIQLAVLARASASGSLGCQVRSGIASAKHTACSPVPQPISSTTPCIGRTRLRTSRIGFEFRAAEGENMRWSARVSLAIFCDRQFRPLTNARPKDQEMELGWTTAVRLGSASKRSAALKPRFRSS